MHVDAAEHAITIFATPLLSPLPILRRSHAALLDAAIAALRCRRCCHAPP